MTQQIKIEPLEPAQGIQAGLEKLFLFNPDALNKIVGDMNDALGDAEQSATDAANSANAAAKSAAAAAASESAVEQSATAAENAADAAKDSENAAKTSENNAAASATDAASSKAAAAKSATAAAESAKITQQNEEILQQYVDDAGQYAANAAASSQDAAGFANDAEQYAEEAKQATAGKADKATTLAGYGITDAYTKTQVDQKINDVQGDVDTLNTKVPSNASASNKMATAAEISNLQNQIDENALEIKGLQGAGGALTATNLGSNPTQQSITEYAIDQIWPNNTNFTWNASNPAASTFTDANGIARTAAEIFNGTWVNNTADNMRWQLTNTQNTTPTVFEWANVGQDIVGIATATTAGIIRVGDGSQMVVSPATGDMSLNASKASEIRNTIGAIASNQGTANAGKILGIGDDGNVVPIDGASGAGRNIGDIFWTTRTDSALNGAVEANGAQYNFADLNGGNNNVQELLDSGALPSVSIAEFDAKVASDGGCDAFGYKNLYYNWAGHQIAFLSNKPAKGDKVYCSSPYVLIDVGEVISVNNLNQTFEIKYIDLWGVDLSEKQESVEYEDLLTANLHGTSSNVVQLYAWQENADDEFMFTTSSTPQVGDPAYNKVTLYDITKVASNEIVVEGHSYQRNATYDTVGIMTTRGVATSYFKVPKKTPRILVRCQKPTADNNYTWYNVYADGRVEQGGYWEITGSFNNTDVPAKTIDLAVLMRDTHYSIASARGATNGLFQEIVCDLKTVSNFRACAYCTAPSSAIGGYWQVVGYADPTEYTKDKWDYQYVHVERPMVQLFNGATDEAVATCTEVLADVAGLKLATDGMIDYVVESQEPTEANGYTWYRKYKSGWVEQGGTVKAGFSQSINWSYRNVSLPIEMIDNSYINTFQATWNFSYGGQVGQDKVYATTDSTATTMRWAYILLSGGPGMFVNWQVSGMSAQGV